MSDSAPESGVSRDSNDTEGAPSRHHPSEMDRLYRARDLLEGLSNQIFRRAERVLERRRNGDGDGTADTPRTAAEAASTALPASASAEASSSSEANTEGSHASRRRRRRDDDSPSSENDESPARRRRRASNVVESLRELMVVPTSSTLGESEGTPRSNTGINADAAGNETDPGGHTSNGLNLNDAMADGTETLRQILRRATSVSNNRISNNNENSNDNEDNTNTNTNTNTNNNINNNNNNNNNNRGESNEREGNEDGDGEDEDDESGDESTVAIDNPSIIDDGLGLGFGIGGLIDRDRILNNLMQRSMGMLRSMENGTKDTTDLKCPVCSEVFVDYELGDHPNAPGNRSVTTCSHGAMSLFTKLHHCPICFEEDIEPPNVVALACGHVVCKIDFCKLGGHVGKERLPGKPKPKAVPKRAREASQPQSSPREGSPSETTRPEASRLRQPHLMVHPRSDPRFQALYQMVGPRLLEMVPTDTNSNATATATSSATSNTTGNANSTASPRSSMRRSAD